MNKQTIQLLSLSILLLMLPLVHLHAQESAPMTIWRMTHPLHRSDINLLGPVQAVRTIRTESRDFAHRTFWQNHLPKKLHFDRQGHIIEYPNIQAHFRVGDSPLPSCTYTAGRLTHIQRLIEEGELYIIIDFDYSNPNILAYTTTYYENGVSVKEYLQDHRVHKIILEGGGPIDVYRHIYTITYNDHHDIATIRGTSSEVEGHERSELDNPNNPQLHITKQSYTFSYIYDSHGNWIQQKVHTLDTLFSSIQREITYYPQ